jgi:hypothetical protein
LNGRKRVVEARRHCHPLGVDGEVHHGATQETGSSAVATGIPFDEEARIDGAGGGGVERELAGDALLASLPYLVRNSVHSGPWPHR